MDSLVLICKVFELYIWKIHLKLKRYWGLAHGAHFSIRTWLKVILKLLKFALTAELCLSWVCSILILACTPISHLLGLNEIVEILLVLIRIRFIRAQVNVILWGLLLKHSILTQRWKSILIVAVVLISERFFVLTHICFWQM